MQHVYRRGHVFWWRRVHRISGGDPVDVRLSLKTFDRSEAGSRGAALSAITGGVTEMLNARVREAGGPTEQGLQTIAKAMYEELLADLCTDQRSMPDPELHREANQAYADYFQRMADNGGGLSLLEPEIARLRAAGWDEQRIAGLSDAVRLREDKGWTGINRADLDRHLIGAGYAPTDRMRWRLELALYRPYRDAYLDANAQLERDAAPTARPASAIVAAPPSPVTSTADGFVAMPEDWLTVTPTQAAERYIEANPRLRGGKENTKRAHAQVGEQTIRQIRWAAQLLEYSLPRGTAIWQVTDEQIKDFDDLLDKIPTSFGKSPADRHPSNTLQSVAERTASLVEEGVLALEDVGLTTGTTNKHFNKIIQIFTFVREHVQTTSKVDLTKYIRPLDTDERTARLEYEPEQGRAIFLLPPWTGCAGVSDRLTTGPEIFHDALFFVLLLVWYTGARREEICKLMLDEIECKHGIYYLAIKSTKMGRIKNVSSRRVVAVSDELIRLGFIRYVEALRAEGEELLFPEIEPAVGTKRKLGDVFYKVWWIYIAPKVPGLRRGQAMHAARHMVSTELKDQETFIEFRNDLLGHRGKGGDGENRYPAATRLRQLKNLVDRIPIVTDHLPMPTTIRLLPAFERTARPSRGR